jgi:hypothetical protein
MSSTADALSSHVEFQHEGLGFCGSLELPRLSVNPSDAWTTLSVAQITIPVIGTLTIFGSPIPIPQGTLLHVTLRQSRPLCGTGAAPFMPAPGVG